MQDIFSEQPHCNIAYPRSLNCSSGSAVLSFVALTIVGRYLQRSKIIFVDWENTETVICNLADTFAFTAMYKNKVMHHAAYRQYVIWQHGHLGLGRLIVIHCVLSELFVAYTHKLLQLTQNLFHPENSQWINKGQLQVSVWIHLKFLSFAPPKLWALRKFPFLTDGTWTWVRFFFLRNKIFSFHLKQLRKTNVTSLLKFKNSKLWRILNLGSLQFCIFH